MKKKDSVGEGMAEKEVKKERRNLHRIYRIQACRERERKGMNDEERHKAKGNERECMEQ